MEPRPPVNIIVTNVCPNKCKYCFAPVPIAHDKSNRSSFMSLDDFLFILSFLKRSKLTNVRLLGGEPLIHPQIKQFLEEIQKEDDFELVNIFTGGIFPHKVIQYLKENRTSIIVNCNHPKDYNLSQYKCLLSNLEMMVDRGLRVVIGYNIYEEDFDYYPIIELCNDFAIDTLRICIAKPNIAKSAEVLGWQERKKIGGRVYSLVMECIDRAIKVIFDCVLTPCTFTDEQWGSITKVFPHVTNSYGVCTPVLDIDADLQVSRCFALDHSPTVSLRNFDNSEELFQFFCNETDAYKWHAVEGECKNCKYFTFRVCQGDCLSFVYSKIVALKESRNKSIDVFKEAYCHLRLQNINFAITKFEEGLELYKGDSTVICDYVFALLKSSQFDKAERVLNYYDRILSVDKFGAYFMLKGLFAEAVKDEKNAIRFYRKAVRKVDTNKKTELLERVKGLEK